MFVTSTLTLLISITYLIIFLFPKDIGIIARQSLPRQDQRKDFVQSTAGPCWIL